MKQKNGISLIVLVVAIIIMIIIAGAIIISLSNVELIDKASSAVKATNLQTVREATKAIWADIVLEKQKGANLDYETEIIKKLKEQGVDVSKYNIEVDKDSVVVNEMFTVLDGINLEEWEFAYVYNRANDTWRKVFKIEEPRVTGDIVAKLYKIDNIIDPEDILFNGTTYVFGKGNEYKMLIEGSGEIPQMMPYDKPNDLVLGGYAWQQETAMQMGGYNVTAFIPYVTEILIDEGITKIGAFAFTASSGLKKILCGKDVAEIDHRAFYISGVEEIYIPDSVNKICEYAFWECKNLKKVKITGVNTLETRAFGRCYSLEKIRMSNITNMNDYALTSCESLTTINYAGTMEQWETVEKGYNWSYNTGEYEIYCTNGTIKKEQ